MTELTPPPTTEPTLQSGSLLAGKYRLEREIGRGAMGTVWLATHLTLEQRVAIKIISREHAYSEELRHRFHTEAKAAARLRSRYVVGVYDHGETTDGLPFIVLEYLEGECLEDRIAREGAMPLRDVVRVARHVGRALSRAHAHGIVHRDLKPANIFITKNEDDEEAGWTAKVLDFGIAKVEGYGEKSATKTGTVLGTPLFMSPEQVRGASAVDRRADLYSLGMVVYNMLTGGYAFDGASFGDLLVSICTEPLPKLRSFAPWLPEELEGWFERACARDPQARFVDAEEMIEALGVAAGEAGRKSVVSLTGATVAGHSAIHSRTDALTVPGSGVLTNPQSTLQEGARDSSNSSISSAGAASVTVNQPPAAKPSRLPWVLGAGLIGIAGVALALWGGTFEAPEEPPSAQAAQPASSNARATSEPEGDEPSEDEPRQQALPSEQSPSPEQDEGTQEESGASGVPDTQETQPVSPRPTRPAAKKPPPRPSANSPSSPKGVDSPTQPSSQASQPSSSASAPAPTPKDGSSAKSPPPRVPDLGF